MYASTISGNQVVGVEKKSSRCTNLVGDPRKYSKLYPWVQLRHEDQCHTTRRRIGDLHSTYESEDPTTMAIGAKLQPSSSEAQGVVTGGPKRSKLISNIDIMQNVRPLGPMLRSAFLFTLWSKPNKYDNQGHVTVTLDAQRTTAQRSLSTMQRWTLSTPVRSMSDVPTMFVHLSRHPALLFATSWYQCRILVLVSVVASIYKPLHKLVQASLNMKGPTTELTEHSECQKRIKWDGLDT
jgi:hypothetical protein